MLIMLFVLIDAIIFYSRAPFWAKFAKDYLIILEMRDGRIWIRATQ